MLMQSKINPFDSQEAKPFKNHPEIVAMTNLVQAYQDNNVREFERLLSDNRKAIMDDPFIRYHVETLLRNIRTQVLLKLLRPYTCIRLSFISSELNIPAPEVEALLVSLILDESIAGRIDQVNGIIVLDRQSQWSRKYAAFDRWARQMDALRLATLGRAVADY